MSDTKTGDDKTLSVNTKKTLTLKRPGMEQGTVRQNFSHGRAKSVVVETKKRKFARPDEKPEAGPAVALFKPKPAPSRAAAAPVVQEAPKTPTAADAARRHGAQRAFERRDGSAPQGARRLEGPRRRRSPAAPPTTPSAAPRRKSAARREREESARRQAEEEARLLAEAEARRRAEEEARRRAPQVEAGNRRR